MLVGNYVVDPKGVANLCTSRTKIVRSRYGSRDIGSQSSMLQQLSYCRNLSLLCNSNKTKHQQFVYFPPIFPEFPNSTNSVPTKFRQREILGTAVGQGRQECRPTGGGLLRKAKSGLQKDRSSTTSLALHIP